MSCSRMPGYKGVWPEPTQRLIEVGKRLFMFTPSSPWGFITFLPAWSLPPLGVSGAYPRKGARGKTPTHNQDQNTPNLIKKASHKPEQHRNLLISPSPISALELSGV